MRCTNAESGEVSECLLLSDYHTPDGQIGAMLPKAIEPVTHQMVLKDDRALIARLMVGAVSLETNEKVLIDPLDFVVDLSKFSPLTLCGKSLLELLTLLLSQFILISS